MAGVLVIPGAASQVARARVFVGETATDALGAGCPGVDDVVLLASETVTNAIRHSDSGRSDDSGRPTGTITIAVLRGDDVIRVEVSDRGCRAGPRPSRSADLLGGRGLELVEAIAARSGYERDRTGTTVWFEIRTTDEGSHAHVPRDDG